MKKQCHKNDVGIEIIGTFIISYFLISIFALLFGIMEGSYHNNPDCTNRHSYGVKVFPIYYLACELVKPRD